MGLGHSPRIVTDELVLSLDASSPKNYNAGISTNWTDKVGGNNGTLFRGAHHNDGPFVGAGYVEFDGTGDYLTAGSASDWTFLHNGSSFTAECWFYTASTSNGTLLSTSATQYNPGFYFNINEGSAGVVRFVLYKGTLGALSVTSSASSFSVNTWNHVAAVYNSSTTTLTLYINGVSAGTDDGSSFAFSSSDSSYTLAVGRYQHSTPGGYIDGYISNVRLVNGTALYTSNFTLPTGPLTATSNTTLLTCQGNTIADASSSAHTITANGDAAANLGSPASAFEFDGSRRTYILSAANPTLNWGTGDFTVELWVNVSSSSTYGTLFSTEVNAQEEEENTFVISMNSSRQVKVTTYSTVLISASSATAISANTWTHIVVTRHGTTLTLYIDKSSAGTATSSINYVAGGYTTGALPRSLSNTNWSGKISNIKVYKGKALTVAEIEQNYNAFKGRYA